MTFAGKCALLFAAIALSSGCGAAARPYARDPLLRDGFGVRGDPTRGQERDLYTIPGPVPPRPPYPDSLASGEDERTIQHGQVSLTYPSAP
jgi:hypothetical protein